MKNNKIDLLSIVLVLFLVSTPVTMYFLKVIHQKANDCIHYSDDIAKLEILNRDLNNFYIKKGSFINYDDINQQVVEFDNLLSNLKSELLEDFFAKKYVDRVLDIEDDFQKSKIFIEKVKSHNSIIAYSLNYLLDLKKSIRENSYITNEEYSLLEDTLFSTMKFYINIDDKSTILSDLKSLNLLAKKSEDKKIVYFYEHEKDILNKILSIHKERKLVKDLKIFKKLTDLNQDMQDVQHKYLLAGGVIKSVLILIIMFLLPIILYLHRKSIKDKNNLISYKYAIENSDNSIIITDLDSNIIFVNEVFEKETGYTKEEVLGKNPRILQSGLMQNEHYKDIYHDLIHNKKWEGEFVNRRKDGTIFYEKASIVPIIVDNKITNYLAIKLNITDYIEQEKRVKFMAYHDVLTSLPNRLSFERYFEEDIIKNNKEVALFYMDLDRFKNINDSLGHHIGDKLLKVFAGRLKEIVGSKNFVARLGGDEFVAVVDNFMQNEIFNLADDIVKSFESSMIIEGHILNVTTSIGVARYPQDANNLEELMMYADAAMYDAKSRGKNQFQFFTKELSMEINQKVEIEQELRGALNNNELYVMYQPKYSLKSGKIVGFEALVRWENEKLGFVPPDQFINIAEETGFIDEIGYFVFERACQDFKVLKQLDSNIRSMAINVSPVQLKDIDFIDNINQVCKDVKISQTGIELEVTETYLMENIEENIQSLYELREYGFKIAIDDFGTGYSSFSYLKRLPINTLKIDKSFIDDICTQKRDKNIVKAIVELANNLNFNIVAEGIEYKEQEELLSYLGANIGQGYLFSKPLKLEDMKKFIENTIQSRSCDIISIKI